MKNKRIEFSTLTVIAMLVLSALFTALPVKAAPDPSMEVINPLNGSHEFNFTTSQKSVGDAFLINISALNVVDLFSWQVKLAWDPTLLAYVNTTLPADHVFTGQVFYPAGPINDSSSVVYGVSLAPGGNTFNGTGRLVQFYLKIIKGVSPGETVECNLTFVNIGFDTFMLNHFGADMSFTPIIGHYSYTAPFIPPPPARIYINPSRVVDPTLVNGSSFSVNLTIADATNVHSWKAKILYNKTILETNATSEGNFLSSSGSTTFNAQVGDYNATHGVIDMNCSLNDPIGTSGNGTLAIIVFNTIGLGPTDLTIIDADLRNPTNIALPFTTANGYFNNMLIAKLSIDPSEVKGPQYVPGATFTINVTLDDVENLRTCIFNLTYFPAVLQEININVPSVLGQIPVKKLMVDDGAGYIWANLTYRNGVTTYEPRTILTVEFMVVAMGVSPINLTDVQMYDLNDQPITPEVNHGIFIGMIRDVAVTGVIANIDIAYQGWIVNINVTVKNNGNITETFGVSVYYTVNATTWLGGTTTVPNLDPGNETTVTIPWNTSSASPCNNYTISATAGPVPFELNLSDNSMNDGYVKIRLYGDITGDGVIDVRDITNAILAFHTYPGRPGWDPLIDLNQDGIIDMRDIVAIIIRFGQRCI